MTKLLITGSRDASDRMLAYARSLVGRAKELGWSVVVGDAAGIDAVVIAEADRMGVPVEVHGGYSKIRNVTTTGSNVKHDAGYPERDKIMAGICDMCIGVWNGKSRGTKITVDAAAALGKTTHLYTVDHLEY